MARSRSVPDTDPYPWPWDGRFDVARLAVVVTGVQRSYADASVDVPGTLDRIECVSTAVRRAGGVVCHVRHTSPGTRARPLLPEIGRADWAPVVRPAPDDVLVSASGHDGFFGSALDAELRSRGRDLVVAVGLAAEVTVSSTVRSANDRGYECLTLVDAAAPLHVTTGHHEHRSVTMSGGIFGALGTVDALLATLRDAAVPLEPAPAPGAATDPAVPLTTGPVPNEPAALEEPA